jgi:hypothetical protein
MSADSSFPLINGTRYGYASIETAVAGDLTTGFKSINYKTRTEAGMTRGTGFFQSGRAEGQNSADGSWEMYKRDWQALVEKLAPPGSGKGWSRVSFLVTVSYAEDGEGVVTDTLYAVRMMSAEDSHSEGPDALVVRCDLSIMRIAYNGIFP